VKATSVQTARASVGLLLPDFGRFVSSQTSDDIPRV
jgi:hypothetical protein